MKQRLKEIDVLRGMALLMVLMYHSVIVYPLDLHQIPWCSNLHLFLWTLQMPLFFLVSGFCFSYSGSYYTYFWKKTKRILIPHVVFAMVDILPRIIPNTFVHERMDAGEALLKFALYGGSDWFLWTLFLISLIFPLFHIIFEKWAFVWKPILFLFLILFIFHNRIPDLFLGNMVAAYLPYYLIGYLLKKNYDNRRETYQRVCKNPAMLVATFIAAMILFVCFLKAQLGYTNRVLEFLCVVCGSLFLYGVAAYCQKKIAFLFQEAGKYSLQMYLLDGYALVFTRTVLVSIIGITNPALIILGNFIPDVLITYIISKYIIEKVKPFRFLCGL